MGENSKISWTMHTWNPWRGCQHATLPDGTEHPGCGHCYAEAMAKRNPDSLGVWGPNGTRVMAVEKTFNAPLKWEEQAYFARQRHNDEVRLDKDFGVETLGEFQRPRVFVDSMCDVFEDWEGKILNHKGNPIWRDTGSGFFHEDIGEPDFAYRKSPLTMNDLRARMFAIIDQCPNIDFLLLTKRPENIRRMWPDFHCSECGGHGVVPAWSGSLHDGTLSQDADDCPKCSVIDPQYRHNCWLLTSVSDQPTADAMIPELLKCRDFTPVLGVSAEPLLGEVDGSRWNRPVPECSFANHDTDGCCTHPESISPECNTGSNCPLVKQWHGLDLWITGGESGPHARPHDIRWAWDVGQQCQAAGISWFHKQMGSLCIAAGDDPSIRDLLLNGQPTAQSVQLGEYHLPYHDAERNVFRIPFKDRAGSDPAEWGDGWLQQMPGRR